MYVQLLENAGLTRNESLVYLALLRVGQARSAAIVQEAGISSGKVYETLARLADKGLVKVSEHTGVKRFEANDPSMMIGYLEERQKALGAQQRELEKALPNMRSLGLSVPASEGVSFVAGMRGTAVIVDAAMHKAKSIVIMGVRGDKAEQFNAFWMRWHRERSQRKITARMLFSDGPSTFSKVLSVDQYTNVRFLEGISPASTMVIDDECFFFTYEKEIHCIHIRSASVARSFLTFYESLWPLAKKARR